MTTTPASQTDGRFQRSERSREAIVQALLDLIGEHILAPTAQQVAERADVGVRTVFRHFSDMDALYAAMNERMLERVLHVLVDTEQTDPLPDRIAGLAANRAKLFSLIEPYRRANVRFRHRSPFLQESHQKTLALQRADLLRWLPELASARAEIREAFDVAASFSTWDRLRSDQSLNLKKSEGTLLHLLTRLSADLEDGN